MKDSRRLRTYPIRKEKRFSILSRWSVTNKLILVNIIFFLLAFLLMISFGKIIFDYIALKPNDVMHGKYLWTFITSMFMHDPVFILHIMINMFVLFSLGNLCEKIIGRKRFLWFYLISGLIAGLIFVFFAYFFGSTDLESLSFRVFGSPAIPAVGASGAIFAIAGLFMILTPRLRFMIIFLPFFSLPAYLMIPLVLFITWIISASVGMGIGNTAHFGGFLAGIIYGLYLRQKYKNKTKQIARYFSK